MLVVQLAAAWASAWAVLYSEKCREKTKSREKGRENKKDVYVISEPPYIWQVSIQFKQSQYDLSLACHWLNRIETC